MNLLLHNNKHAYGRIRNSSTPTKFFFAAVFIGILFFIAGVPILDILARGSMEGARPLFGSVSVAEKIGAAYAPLIASEQKLLRDNEELRAKLSTTNARLWTAELLEEENNRLKILLGRAESSEDATDRVVGNIQTSAGNNPYGTFIIDIGNVHGVTKGDVVFATDRIAIGEIASVYGAQSTVTLYSASQKKTRARLGAERIPVEIIGRSAGDFELQLPKELAVAVGDLLVSENINPAILGVVEFIQSEPTNALQHIYISVPTNIHTLDKIFIKRRQSS